jgi:phosphate starvation-inducible PhoH-like protein
MKILKYLSIPFLVSSSYSTTLLKSKICKNMMFMSKKAYIPLNTIYTPKTENQKLYIEALNKKQDYITIAIGPAGTGKTLLACTKAIESFKLGLIEKIIITRPAVSVEEDIGYLPGTLVKKMDPWTRPILDIFEETYSKTQINNMIFNGQIEISPLGFMRGRTFKNAFIIADEMQNSSPNQMYMLLTRIGKNSKMVLTGDLEQSDKLENNGLKDFIIKYKTRPNNNTTNSNISIIEFKPMDVQRSVLVEEIISLYKKNDYNSFSYTNKSQNTNPKPIPILNNTQTVQNFTLDYGKEIGNANADAALIPIKDYKSAFKSSHFYSS